MKDTFYEDIYEKLYRHDYRKEDYHNAKDFLKYVIKHLEFTTILDVGCSNGCAVNILANNDKKVTGIDVSKTAIKRAKRMKRNCQFGSAIDIPFPDSCFDVVYSSDTLEHLREDDVDKCMKEFYRVSKRYVAIQIATTLEGSKGKKNWIKKADIKEILHLHLTVWNKDMWREKFFEYKWQCRWEGLETRKNISFIFEK